MTQEKESFKSRVSRQELDGQIAAQVIGAEIEVVQLTAVAAVLESGNSPGWWHLAR